MTIKSTFAANTCSPPPPGRWREMHVVRRLHAFDQRQSGISATSANPVADRGQFRVPTQYARRHRADFGYRLRIAGNSIRAPLRTRVRAPKNRKSISFCSLRKDTEAGGRKDVFGPGASTAPVSEQWSESKRRIALRAALFQAQSVRRTHVRGSPRRNKGGSKGSRREHHCGRGDRCRIGRSDAEQLRLGELAETSHARQS